jgi:hypothetical protein
MRVWLALAAVPYNSSIEATEEQVLADILGSNEFFQQATQGREDEHESADVRYIEALFQDLLGYKK